MAAPESPIRVPASPDAQAPPTGASGGGDEDLLVWARRVGEELRESYGAILSALPGHPSRPAQLVQLLGVNRDIAGRLISLSSADDPLEVLNVAPGPDPLRRISRAAARHELSPEILTAADEAASAFDRLIDRGAGNRGALDSVIAAGLPEARAQLEVASKYSIFKGLAQLRGMQMDVWMQSVIVHPSARQPDRLDLAFVYGIIGLQRFRPGLAIHNSTRKLDPPNPTPEALKGSVGESPEFDLAQFCTNHVARWERRQVGRVVRTAFTGPALGPPGRCDAFSVDLFPGGFGYYSTREHDPRLAVAATVEAPSAWLVLDLLLHVDAFPGADPKLLVYDMGSEGQAQIHDPERDADLMEVSDRIESLGQGPGRLAEPLIPRYPQLIGHVCERLGWDAESLRTYRCRVPYPVVGWQYTLAFTAPPKPG